MILLCTVFLASATLMFVITIALQANSLGLLNADLFSVTDLSDLGSSLTTSGINSRIEFSREAVEMSLQEFAEMFATKAKVVDHQGQSKKSSATSNNTGIGKIISTGVRNTANSIKGCFVSKTTWNSEQVSGFRNCVVQ